MSSTGIPSKRCLNGPAIIGAGWLGRELASHWASLHPRLTTTTPEKLTSLSGQGFSSVELFCLGQDLPESLQSTRQLVLNVPPRPEHPEQLKRLLDQLPQLQRLVFIGSTSVFGNHQGDVFEDTPPEPEKENGHILLQCEQLLKSRLGDRLTVLRCAGLVGEDRHPLKHFQGRTNIPGGLNLVNMIHRNDVIRWIDWIFSQDRFGLTIHAVHPEDLSKQDYYAKSARIRGGDEPIFAMTNTPHKRVRSRLVDTFPSYTSIL